MGPPAHGALRIQYRHTPCVGRAWVVLAVVLVAAGCAGKKTPVPADTLPVGATTGES
jgi:hypothetical protein